MEDDDMKSLVSAFHVRLPFTVPLVLRYLLVTLLLTGFVLGCWSSITPIAHAATHAAATPKHAHHATGSQPQPAVTPQPGKHRRHPATVGTGAVNGLGILPFYTYVNQRLTDHTTLSVNVANGNLVIDSHNLSIAGTGLPLSLDTFYNSQMVVNGHSGVWKLIPWGMVTLHVNSDGSADYTGPSGFTATFTKNSDGSYNDAPGIDATLVKSGVTYTLTFHASGEVYVFNGGGLTTDKDRNGNQVTLGSGGSLTDTQGRVTTGVSSSGLLSLITDPSGRTVQYSYTTGLLTGITDLAGKTTSFGYNGSQQLTSITDPLSHGTTITYGNATRVTSITDATGAKTTFAIDTFNMKTTVTDANGHATVYTWDSQGRVIKIVDALNHTRTISFSNDNKPSQTIDALNTQTNFTYDTNANLTQVQNMGTGETASWAFGDSNHPFLPTSQTDPQANVLRYTYDSKGNLITVAVPYLESTKILYSYVYNSNGTLSTLTDAYGNVTSYGYDSHGNQTSITHPSPLGGEAFTYDSVSRVSTSTDGLSQQTTYTYDNLDRVTQLAYTGGITVSSVYDDNGNLTSMTDPTGTTSYTYDKDNRVLTKTLPGGTQLSYSYDPVGNLLSFTDGGGQVSYGYNQVNELTTLTEPGGARTSFGYDADGQRTSTSYPNGVVMSMVYDKAGHLDQIKAVKGSTTLSNFTYSYGSQDLYSGSADTNLNSTTYTYDGQDRLVEASVSHLGTQINDFKYQYDWVGNLTSSTLGIGATPTSYSYNAANELTGSTQGSITTNYTYDADGNLSGWTGNGAPGYSFNYNTLNQTTGINGSNYSYSGSDQTDRVQAGNTSYVYSFNGISSQTDSSGTTYYTRCSCAKGTLVDERTPTGAYYYLFDGLGSIVGLTDSNGTLVSTYQYDPYGNLTSSTGSVANPWRFAGGYLDSSTGLYKFGTR
jgi:YD repeat-containing protein